MLRPLKTNDELTYYFFLCIVYKMYTYDTKVISNLVSKFQLILISKTANCIDRNHVLPTTIVKSKKKTILSLKYNRLLRQYCKLKVFDCCDVIKYI